MAQTLDLTPPEVNLRLYEGDNVSILFTFTDLDGVAIDITGRTYTSDITRGADGEVEASFTCVVSDGPAGEMTMTLDDSLNLRALDDCEYDVQQLNGSDYITIVQGQIRVDGQKTS